MPVSPQPNQVQYTTDKLNLFPVFKTRAAYLAATGHQAPPFNVNRKVQQWEDPSATKSTQYGYPDIHNEPSYLSYFTLASADANHVNLPGAYSYPAPVYPPTDALQTGPYGPIGKASVDQICMKSDADALAKELQPLWPNLVPTVAELQTGTYFYQYGSDPRRQWAITFGNQTFVAQTLIELKNYHGVGSPGHFALAANGGPIWVDTPGVTIAPPGSVYVPVPIRPLFANEKLVAYISPNPTMAPEVVVHRTDLAPLPNADGSAPGSTGVSVDLTATLGWILDVLNRIAVKEGV